MNLKLKILLTIMIFISLFSFSYASCETNTCSISFTVPIILIYSPTCPHCAKVEQLLAELDKNYDLNIVKINAKEDPQLFKKIIESFNRNDYTVPKIIINNKLFSGDQEIYNNLEKEIKYCETNGCDAFSLKNNDKNNTKKKITILSVFLLALSDSINPCALAVLLILLTVVLLKFNKKKIISYSTAFILTVYISYFLMGIALILGFKSLSKYIGIGSNIFAIIFGIFALILAILNFKDFIAYGKFGFVMEVPMSWRPTLKKLIRDVTSIYSAIVIAFIVSFFLLPCTAGPYFLVNGLLYNLPWEQIIPYLLFYNLIFVLPMILISTIVYFGFAKIENLEEKRTKYIRYLHLITSIVLLLIALYLFFLY